MLFEVTIFFNLSYYFVSGKSHELQEDRICGLG